jgi:SAM-dependent methyltransferase
MPGPLSYLIGNHLPEGARRRVSWRIQRLLRPAWLGTLGRTTPLSVHWGSDRGTPVDRFYIEQFLEEHRRDVRGQVLEVRDNRYTALLGSEVTRSDVLDIDPTNPRATIVADLTAADAVGANQFDCFVLTQTLQFIFDLESALYHAHRVLRPGGVLLATVPALSRVDRSAGLEGDYWRFTAAACKRLFGIPFGEQNVAVRSYGNVLTGVAFLMGMAREELSQRQLIENDPYVPLVLAVRAVKTGT